jgi:chemotaxis protein CheC
VTPFDRSMAMIAERGAEGASQVLSRWIGRPVHLGVSEARRVELAEATALLGPEESLVASCAMGLTGRLTGQLLLVFEDRAGLALVDLLLGQPAGTASSWGELERSAALETANIVGCAYLNALSAHLPPPPGASAASAGEIVPSPPVFRHEFVASLLEFTLMDQALAGDRSLVFWARFAAEVEGGGPSWSLVLVPGGESARSLVNALSDVANG